MQLTSAVLLSCVICMHVSQSPGDNPYTLEQLLPLAAGNDLGPVLVQQLERTLGLRVHCITWLHELHSQILEVGAENLACS